MPHTFNRFDSRIARLALALLVLTGGVGAVVVAGSEPASGAVVSGLQVADLERELGPNGEVQAVRLDTQVTYEFSSSHPLDRAELQLFVAPEDGSYTALDTLTLADAGVNGSDTVDLSGDLLSLDAFRASAFSPQQGGSTSETVNVKVVFKGYRDGTRVAVADASDSATIAVSRQDLTVSARVTGDGEFSISAGSG